MYKIKKVVLQYCMLCLVLIGMPLYGEALQVVRTKYFDIIYAEQSAETAALLAEYADGYADEICARLHKDMRHHIPVYLVPNTQELNGYFISMPYARIVLYDTAVDDGILGNFPNTLLDVFYHELTHAISLDGFFKFLHFVQPLSFTEGVAVSFESLGGAGRVNDPLVKHYLIQNKIDGTTPLWQEAAGARDTYPGGLWPYIYGGYFADYLQKTYGMDTYAELWQDSWRVLPPHKFKSIFKKDIQSVWNQCINTIPLPGKLEEPVSFFSNAEKSGYTALAAAPDGFAYYDFDRKGVYFSRFTGDAPVQLFSADTSLSRLSFSEDGTELIASDSMQTSDTVGLIGGSNRALKRSRIFNMKTKQFTDKPFFSTLAACFLDHDTLCAITIKNQRFSVDVIDRESQKIKKTLYTAGPGEPFAALYSICPIGDRKVACIAANGIKRTILFIDSSTGSVTALPHEQVPAAIRYLQAVKSGDEYVLSFSWAETDMLYRLGLYYPASGTMKLQDTDVSGGVFFPAVIPEQHRDNGGELAHRVVYAGHHSTYHCLYTLNESALTAATVQPVTEDNLNAASPKPNTALLQSMKPFSYQPFAWLWKANISPTATIPRNLYDIGHYGIGMNLFMLDPTETVKIEPSLQVFGKPFFLQGSVAATVSLNPISLHVSAADVIDTPVFKYRRTGFGAGIAYTVPLNYAWEAFSVGYSGNVYWLSELTDKAATYYTAPYRFTVLSHQSIAGYNNTYSSSIAKTPFYAKDTQGFSTALAGTHAYCVETEDHAAIIQARAKWHVPFIPVSCTIGSYIGFNAKYEPSLGYFMHPFSGFSINAIRYLPAFDVYEINGLGKSSVPQAELRLYGAVSAIGDITLFSYEIQRSSSFFPLLFFNRFAIHSGYTGIITKDFQLDGAMQYLDTAYVNAAIELNGRAKLGIEYVHPLRLPTQLGKIGIITQMAW